MSVSQVFTGRGESSGMGSSCQPVGETWSVPATTVSVPPERLARWVANFETRHGATAYAVREGALTGRADDGSSFVARLPFGAAYDGSPGAEDLAAAAVPPG